MEPDSFFVMALGPEPEWKKCACGALVSSVPCWDCEAVSLRETNRGTLAGVPARYTWAKADAPELAERVKLFDGMPTAVALERLRGASRALLVGPAQKGKTSLAVAALRERKVESFFVRAELLGLSRAQSKLGHGESKLVERAMTTGLLLLDDIGSEGEAEGRIQAVRDTLFERLEENRPTWVTTGLDAAQLTARYGAGIVARLRSGVVLRMEGTAVPATTVEVIR